MRLNISYMYRSINKVFRLINKHYRQVILLCIISNVFNISICAQDTAFTPLSMKEAVELALKNSYVLKNADLVIEQTKLEKQSSFAPGTTDINYKNGQMYGVENSQYLEVNQNFGSILKHIQTLRKAKENQQLSCLLRDLAEKQVIAEVKTAYTYWQYNFQIAQINFNEKELYQDLSNIAELKYKTGDISLLKKVLFSTKVSEINSQYLVSTDELTIAENKLKQIIGASGNYIPSTTEPEMYMIDRSAEIVNYTGSNQIDYYNTRHMLAQKEIELVKSEYFPEIKAGAFRQNIGSIDNLYGWQVGIALPLWIPKQSADIKKAQIASEIALNELEQKQLAINYETENLLFELNKFFHQIRHYEETALGEAEIILNTATLQLQNEEIEYSEFLESASTSFQIKRRYYLAMMNYNQTAIQLEIYAE